MRVIALLLLVAAGPSLAQSAPGADARARKLMAEGQFDDALKVLDGAVASERDGAELVRLHLQRGQCLLALGNPATARAAFVSALKRDPTATLDPLRASPDALALLDEARLEVPATVSVAVNGNATVRIDGKPLGPAPLTVEVKAGVHVIEAAGADGRTARLELAVGAGRKTQAALELRSASDPVGPLDGGAHDAVQAEVCGAGRSISEDTAGHCCWPGQVWSARRCVGVPTSCPRDFVMDAAGQRCSPPKCTEGMERAGDELHCCWPEQAWSSRRNTCVGVPACPRGWSAAAELKDGAERCLKDPTLARAAFADAECAAAKFGERRQAFTCSVPEYLLKSRADLTAEELTAVRAQFRLDNVARCNRLAAAAGCVVRGDATQLTFCCR